MFRQVVVVLSTLLLAFFVLSVSVLRSASPNYAFTGAIDGAKASTQTKVEYNLPYPGSILPDHPLWFVKAIRDKLWYLVTLNSSKRAELTLLFADKRLAAAKILFEREKPEVAFSTLSKGEKYLEEANNLSQQNLEKGLKANDLEYKLALAALKHRQVIEEEILGISPEDAKPKIIKLLDYPKVVYKINKEDLKTLGREYPESPFSGD